MIFGRVLDWFADPVHWAGPRGIPVRVTEHLLVSGVAMLAAVVAVMPLALFLAHRRKGQFLAASLVNLGRAVPSFGIIVLAAMITIRFGLGLGFWPTLVALVALAVPPIFTNTYAGVTGIDQSIVESARGMGLKEGQILWRIESPLARRVIVAGLRIATVQVVATATLGAVLTFGGLGRFIVDGFAKGDHVEVFSGAVLVALLTFIAEGIFWAVQRPGRL